MEELREMTAGVLVSMLGLPQTACPDLRMHHSKEDRYLPSDHRLIVVINFQNTLEQEVLGFRKNAKCQPFHYNDEKYQLIVQLSWPRNQKFKNKKQNEAVPNQGLVLFILNVSEPNFCCFHLQWVKKQERHGMVWYGMVTMVWYGIVRMNSGWKLWRVEKYLIKSFNLNLLGVCQVPNSCRVPTEYLELQCNTIQLSFYSVYNIIITVIGDWLTDAFNRK